MRLEAGAERAHAVGLAGVGREGDGGRVACGFAHHGAAELPVLEGEGRRV
ncbi:MAG TPA: hypothetical protein VF621_06020 [Pyrinomonadaceae bacterium]